MFSLKASWARGVENEKICTVLHKWRNRHYLQHKHEFKNTCTHITGTQSDFSNLHQQVKIIITQAGGGTMILITGMNYNIYTACFICGWQTDGSVAF